MFVGTPSGSVVSDPAILQTVERGGAVLFANIDGFYGIDAPVFAADGVTSLPAGGTGLAGVSQASQVELNRLSWDGPVVLSVNNGNAGEVYELQSSSDLTQWSLAATAVSSGRLTRVMVGAPRHTACRFYRAVRREQ